MPGVSSAPVCTVAWGQGRDTATPQLTDTGHPWNPLLFPCLLPGIRGWGGVAPRIYRWERGLRHQEPRGGL